MLRYTPIFIVASAFLIYQYYFSYFVIRDAPKPDESEWWGSGITREHNRAVSPFKINVPESDLKDLKDRLKRFLQKPHVQPLKNQGFQYGFNSDFLKQVVTYWVTDYDWRKREVYLNQFPQFKTNILGLDIHFIRASPERPGKKKVLPLLLLHGWPGSVREFYDVIPLLITPRDGIDFVFEVVVPSLPGYGFSQGSTKAGLGPAQMAVIMKALMTRLNFNKFYVAGGDWGSIIGKNMGQFYPDNVLGFHSTMCMVNTPLSNIKWFLGSLFPSFFVEEKFVSRMYPVQKVISGVVKEMGYFLIQATKPDTIGTALSDTPAGLAAYILEKFSTWTNKKWMNLQDGGLTQKYSLDALLDNIMLYWFTDSITTSQRLYSEFFNPKNSELNWYTINIPTACARFEHELLWQPASFLAEQYTNLLHVSDISEGGHFGAFEEPKKFNEDLWTAVKTFEDFHKSKSKTAST